MVPAIGVLVIALLPAWAILPEQEALKRKTLRTVQQLQGVLEKERALKKTRLRELDQVVKELESRKRTLNARVDLEQRALRGSIRALHHVRSNGALLNGESELKSKALLRIAAAQHQRLEGLAADQADVAELESRIALERGQLESVVQDLREHDSLSGFHTEVASSLKGRVTGELLTRLTDKLERLQKTREMRAEVEALMQGLSARAELQRLEDAETSARGPMRLGEFVRRKGSLERPVAGARVIEWGRYRDPETGLYLFRKGIELEPSSAIPVDVIAVAPGKVVFAGTLGEYGRAVVLDHGAGHYTLTGQLGKTLPSVGAFVRERDVLGQSFPKKPVYFELRAGRTPVNPLQWLR